MKDLIKRALKKTLKGGRALAVPAALTYGATQVLSGLGKTDPADVQAEKDRDFQRELELERRKHQYALEQIKAQTGASDAQAEALLQAMKDERLFRQAIVEKSLDPALYAQRAAIDQANWERQQELSRIAGVEQTRELTRRKIEGDVIGAWKGITEAQINADARIGLGLMNLAYTSGMPNPNILQAGASLAGQGRSAYGTPSSLIS